MVRSLLSVSDSLQFYGFLRFIVITELIENIFTHNYLPIPIAHLMHYYQYQAMGIDGGGIQLCFKNWHL